MNFHHCNYKGYEIRMFEKVLGRHKVLRYYITCSDIEFTKPSHAKKAIDFLIDVY